MYIFLALRYSTVFLALWYNVGFTALGQIQASCLAFEHKKRLRLIGSVKKVKMSNRIKGQ
jgi:hypothetical protein